MPCLTTRLRGGGLPPKTLCLTYDDGPGRTAGPGLGPRTDELGAYLFAQGIPATFFVLGQRAATAADLLAQLRGWGHRIANHTATHADLPALLPDSAAVVAEVAEVADDHEGDPLLLRPPFGAWSSEVATILAADPRTRRYTGPVLWDVDGKDWEHWRDGATAETCADAYFARIEEAGSGIVLLHDSSAEEALARVNNTYALTRLLVPRLVKHGYRFLPLDEAPEIRAALQAQTSPAATPAGALP
ncbi:MAG TPA: polysaccharide deacetylase family protein [Thermoanaerobaculia bacterium]|nr:polysaccharide deacetylase family protein [Thermoanaerobaculia bacterium]